MQRADVLRALKRAAIVGRLETGDAPHLVE
jgi:hypothetical protein